LSDLQAFILGLIQGLTEFLPISSSGHLVLSESLFHIHKQGVTFEVFVHFGTLLAVLTAFWKDITGMLRAFWQSLSHPKDLPRQFRQDAYFKLLVLIIVGTIPAVIMGLLFKDYLEAAFSEPFLVSIMLVVTGTILLSTRFVGSSGREIGARESLAIGFSQALAIIPGISRSGSTISAALWMGIPKTEAARFSFLLAIPAILGATALQTAELLTNTPETTEIAPLIVGTLTAYGSGLLAIRFLLDVIRRGKFSYFALYCYAIGFLGMAYFL